MVEIKKLRKAAVELQDLLKLAPDADKPDELYDIDSMSDAELRTFMNDAVDILEEGDEFTEKTQAVIDEILADKIQVKEEKPKKATGKKAEKKKEPEPEEEPEPNDVDESPEEQEEEEEEEEEEEKPKKAAAKEKPVKAEKKEKAPVEKKEVKTKKIKVPTKTRYSVMADIILSTAKKPLTQDEMTELMHKEYGGSEAESKFQTNVGIKYIFAIGALEFKNGKYSFKG